MTSVDDKYADFLKEIEQLDSAVVASSSIAAVAAPEEQPEPATSGGYDIPWECPWQTALDETHGVPYYWHCETGETSWEPPVDYLAYLTAWERACAGLDGKLVEKDKKKKKKTKKTAAASSLPSIPADSNSATTTLTAANLPSGIDDGSSTAAVYGPDLPSMDPTTGAGDRRPESPAIWPLPQLPAGPEMAASSMDSYGCPSAPLPSEPNSGSFGPTNRPNPPTAGVTNNDNNDGGPNAELDRFLASMVENSTVISVVNGRLTPTSPPLTAANGGVGLFGGKSGDSATTASATNNLLPDLDAILPKKSVYKFWDPSTSDHQQEHRPARARHVDVPSADTCNSPAKDLFYGPGLPPSMAEDADDLDKDPNSKDADAVKTAPAKSLVAYALDDDSPSIGKTIKLLSYDDSDQEDDESPPPETVGLGAPAGGGARKQTEKKAAFRKRFMEELYGPPPEQDAKPKGKSSSAYAKKLGFVKSNTVVAQDEKHLGFVEVDESAVAGNRPDTAPSPAESPGISDTEVIGQSEELLDQISALNIMIENMSSAEIVLVQIKTRLKDFQAGQLSSKYLADRLGEAKTSLMGFVEDCLDDGWELSNWNRETRKFIFRNLATGKAQSQIPVRKIIPAVGGAPSGAGESGLDPPRAPRSESGEDAKGGNSVADAATRNIAADGGKETPSSDLVNIPLPDRSAASKKKHKKSDKQSSSSGSSKSKSSRDKSNTVDDDDKLPKSKSSKKRSSDSKRRSEKAPQTIDEEYEKFMAMLDVDDQGAGGEEARPEPSETFSAMPTVNPPVKQNTEATTAPPHQQLLPEVCPNIPKISSTISSDLKRLVQFPPPPPGGAVMTSHHHHSHLPDQDGDDMDIDDTDTDDDELHPAAAQVRKRRRMSGSAGVDSPAAALSSLVAQGGPTAVSNHRQPPLPPGVRPSPPASVGGRGDELNPGIGESLLLLSAGGDRDSLGRPPAAGSSRGSSASHSPSPVALSLNEMRHVASNASMASSTSGVVSSSAVIYEATPVAKPVAKTIDAFGRQVGDSADIGAGDDVGNNLQSAADPIFAVGGSGFDVYDSLDMEDYDDALLKSRALEPDVDLAPRRDPPADAGDAEMYEDPRPQSPYAPGELIDDSAIDAMASGHLPAAPRTASGSPAPKSCASGSENGDPLEPSDLPDEQISKKPKKKKEKPTKMNNTLSMKRKGIDDLVAKWKQVSTGERKNVRPSASDKAGREKGGR